ncbi:MAG TPA: hypothetical protein VG167_03400 [Verrucomicrobiae bacterium]|nr:hypothetical protein [Verrucomicrobiae bacterium]
MGLLNLFSKPSASVQRLPRGSLTIDRKGQVVATTVPSAFPAEVVQEVGAQVLRLFEEARRAQMPLAELNLHFASLQITARELRGGAVIFLKPKNLFLQST